MYRKIVRKDALYDGQFYTCVKTTKIFCLPSCRAKIPLKQNVEFVESAEDALEKGYRPCKRCYPLNDPDFCPSWLKTLDQYFTANLHRMVSDTEISELIDLDISTVRRYFKKKHSMSIKKYFRLMRLKQAKKMIAQGIQVQQIASLVGYSSVKGFKLAFKNHYGDLPYGHI